MTLRILVYTAMLGTFLAPFSVAQGTAKLIDKELSKFEKWMGIPHSSVPGLPVGTFQSDNVHKGTPLGLDNDLKNVFSVIEEEGSLILKITGEIYGGLTTKDEFENYHFSTKFKWGDKKWPPREKIKRDTGILYHCYGEHGRFWHTWKTCLEYQVQETDLGDFIPLGGNSAKPKVGGPLTEIRGTIEELPNGRKKKSYDSNSETYIKGQGYMHASSEHDAPHGEWNHLELYVLGNSAVHIVNGEIVFVVENALKPDKTPLVKGAIQIQSEAAECYYKEIEITTITEFPKFITDVVKFKSGQ